MGCGSSQDVKSPVSSSSSSKKMQSKVLRTKEQQREFKDLVFPNLEKHREIKDFELIFRASEKGFRAASFHQATNEVKNTVLLFRTKEGNIFGAYTPCQWKNQVMYSYETDLGKKSFLFRLSLSTDKMENKPAKLFQLLKQQQAIMNNDGNGPVFGKGHDLLISDNCNKNESWANIGQSYKSQFPYASNKANKELCGEQRFLIEEYEVWALVL